MPAWGSNSGDSSVFGDGESVGLECTGFNLYVFVLLFSFLFVCFKI
ncbi:MAG: hypothetical protein LBD03_06990 [Methanobrevibacter sp.]|nr:hypothetical protein [Candidatus Methanovirga procula]